MLGYRKEVCISSVCFGLLLLPLPLMAAPFVISDPYPTGSIQPTHCGVWLNSNAKVEIPVTSGPSGVYCKYDVGSVTVGVNSVKMSHILKDVTWGNQESVQSSPLSFTKPGVPVVPSGLGLSN